MESIIIYIAAPLVTGFAGWFANAYRNKHKKEADQIEVAKQYKELLNDALEDKRTLYQEIDILRGELQKVKEEVAAVKEEKTTMRIAMSRAARCNYASKCPVLEDI